jgi:hypothetical protein
MLLPLLGCEQKKSRDLAFSSSGVKCWIVQRPQI